MTNAEHHEPDNESEDEPGGFFLLDGRYATPIAFDEIKPGQTRRYLFDPATGQNYSLSTDPYPEASE